MPGPQETLDEDMLGLAAHPEQQPPPGADTSHWTIDKRVPLALILTMVAQFVGVVFWVATINAAVVSQDRRITALEFDSKSSTGLLSDVRVLLGRIDERTAQLTEAIHHVAVKP